MSSFFSRHRSTNRRGHSRSRSNALCVPNLQSESAREVVLPGAVRPIRACHAQTIHAPRQTSPLVPYPHRRHLRWLQGRHLRLG